jgi:hypothetical protein
MAYKIILSGLYHFIQSWSLAHYLAYEKLRLAAKMVKNESKHQIQMQNGG